MEGENSHSNHYLISKQSLISKCCINNPLNFAVILITMLKPIKIIDFDLNCIKREFYYNNPIKN